LTREEALAEVKKRISNQRLINHMIATGAAMRKLAEHFGEDPDLWEITGILHDIDLEDPRVLEDMSLHSKIGAEIVRQMGMPQEVVDAILTHNPAHGIEPTSLMGKVLRAVDPLTGLIVAATLVLPSKKLADLKVKSVKKRFKEKRFAAGANREEIKRCEEFGLSLEEFIRLTLEGMREVAHEIGL